ncbi:hypothetical protein BWQ96_09652 [Gracilariopsis chorda]|uniref:Uncharacterized protein n=1 Tax=Gracilariopsis chorda TaxID=448386 RepID=A0A2V3IEZ7_9FLOR|nr:hypothetical protein BWQ96_09652 [Gracilariopsis chorda]|eukprot:PXF40621.1 hypothetical protein BWQ96_09652 [Gracilariopsis chorda]
MAEADTQEAVASRADSLELTPIQPLTRQNPRDVTPQARLISKKVPPGDTGHNDRFAERNGALPPYSASMDDITDSGDPVKTVKATCVVPGPPPATATERNERGSVSSDENCEAEGDNATSQALESRDEKEGATAHVETVKYHGDRERKERNKVQVAWSQGKLVSAEPTVGEVGQEGEHPHHTVHRKPAVREAFAGYSQVYIDEVNHVFVD